MSFGGRKLPKAPESAQSRARVVLNADFGCNSLAKRVRTRELDNNALQANGLLRFTCGPPVSHETSYPICANASQSCPSGRLLLTYLYGDGFNELLKLFSIKIVAWFMRANA